MIKLIALSLSVAFLLLSFPAGTESQSAGASSTRKPHPIKDLPVATNPHPVGATRDLPAGTVLQAADVEVLKDIQIICCDVNELVVTDKAKLIGKRLRRPIAKHEEILTSEVF